MNVRTSVRNRADERTHVTGRPGRSSERSRAGTTRRAQPRRIEPGDNATRSTAAQRAYERRQQRAALHGNQPAAAVLPKRRRSGLAARIPFVAAIIGMLSVGLAITLLLTTRSAEDSYQLSEARSHNQDLIEQKAALQRDVESADSAPELASKARDLGMIPAKDPARLVVAPDGGVAVIGTPKPAEGAPAPLLNGAEPARVPANAAGRGTPSNTARGEAPVPSNPTQVPHAPANTAPSVQAAPAPAAPAPAPAAPTPAAPAPASPAPAPEAAAPVQVPPPAAAVPAPQPAPAQPAATPQAPNGAPAQPQGEQLVPMTNTAQAPASEQR